jgi:hypothetical protein
MPPEAGFFSIAKCNEASSFVAPSEQLIIIVNKTFLNET